MSAAGSDMPAVASPCIGVCELDENELCLGCGRSLQEIADWSAAGDTQRRAIVERARSRMQNIAARDKRRISNA